MGKMKYFGVYEPNTRQWRCQLCNTPFPKKTELRVHLGEVHGRVNSQINEPKFHTLARYNTDTLQWECLQCADENFENTDDFYKHYRLEHGMVRLNRSRLENIEKAPPRAIDLWMKIKHRKSSRKWDGLCGVTKKEFAEWYASQPKHCAYCGITHRELIALKNGWGSHLGVDRMDTKGDYTVGNMVLCCKVCNQAKWDVLTYDEMVWLGLSLRRIWEERLNG